MEAVWKGILERQIHQRLIDVRDCVESSRANINARTVYRQQTKSIECRKRFVRNGQAGSDFYGERGARTYNGGLGAVPPVGSRGKAPGQEVGG